MPRTLIIVLLFAGFLGPGFAAETKYRIGGHSYVEYAVLHMGLSTARGKLTGVSGTFSLDPERGTGTMDVTVDPTSLVTGDATLDRILRGSEWLNAEQFPAIRFRGEKFEFAQGKLARVDGSLTLLDATRPVTLTVERQGCGKSLFTGFRETCGADAVALIKRSDFGMSRQASVVADEVRLTIGIEATVEGSPNN
jgi:polyisoprenoid-binding protein YceI